MPPHHLRDERRLSVAHMGPNNDGVAVVLEGALQHIAEFVLKVDDYRDAVAHGEVIDLQCDGAVRGVVITFGLREAEGPVPERELADAILHSAVKLSLDEAQGAIVQQQLPCAWVPPYLGERKYIVRVFLLDGLDITRPSEEHYSGHSGVHQ